MQQLAHLYIFVELLLLRSVSGFTSVAIHNRAPLQTSLQLDRTGKCEPVENDTPCDRHEFEFTTASRRGAVARILKGAWIVLGASAFNVDQAAHAAKTTYPPGTIFRSGKTPLIPGAKPNQNKGDDSGTRRDSNFLRSVADCKNKCENTQDPDGSAKTKEECLSECQDICCTTYEQCTFAIVPRV